MSGIGRLLAATLVAVCLCGTAAWGQEPSGSTPAIAPPPAAPEAAAAPSESAPAAGAPAIGAPTEAPAPGAAPATENPQEYTLTLWDMIEQGGFILWIIMGLSVVAVALAVHLVITVTPNREVPPVLFKRAISQIQMGDLRGAYQVCEGREELLAKVLRAGLKASGHDRFVIQEAMESEGERGATALWQRISYINSIANIAPLLGLLGTVFGMIVSFGAIALDDSQVKTLTMAHGVAMAMLTTAAGLMLAIPCMLLHQFCLRSRVIRIVALVEAHASEVVELLTRGREQ